MSIGISKITDDAFVLLEKGRIIPALHELKRAREMTRIPERRLFLTYNIGVLYWDKLGDGVAAKSEFVSAVNMEIPASSPICILKAHALENLMLSASSFEEFDSFSTRLRELAPGEPVLAGLPPEVKRMRDSGSPWSSVLLTLAMSNYHRTSLDQDRGRYGVARSTYHILLHERRRQRLSREDWRTAIVEYCALGMRMASDCAHLRGGDADRHSPEEFLPILTESLPFVDEYLQIYSGDEMVVDFRQEMRIVISNWRQRWTMIAPEVRPQDDMVLSPRPSRRYRCRQCHKTVLNLMLPCPSCGNLSGPMMVFPVAVALAIAVAVFVWRFLNSKMLLLRGLSALAAAVCILAIVGPVIFNVTVSLMSDDDS